MNREELVLNRLRAANPAPNHARIDPDEISAIFSLLEERRDTVSTHTPIRPPSTSNQHIRYRPAMAFGVAMVLVIVVIGVGFMVFGGGGDERVISPSETTPPTATTAPAPTTTPNTQPQAGEPTVPLPAVTAPELSWTMADFEFVITSLVASESGFVLATDGLMYVSPDGAGWSEVANAPPAGNIRYVAFGDDRYITIGPEGEESYSWTSADLVTWERGPATDVDPWGLAYGEPGFVAVGADDSDVSSAPFWFSPDGLTWERLPNTDGVFSGLGAPYSWMITRDVAHGPGGYVAIGEDDFTSGDVMAAVWFSPNGVNWQRIPHDNDVFGIPDTATWFQMFKVTYGPTGYVAVGVIDGPDQHNGAFWHSADGISWQLTEYDLEGAEFVEDVVAIEGGYLAVGSVGVYETVDDDVAELSLNAALWFSPDGRDWTFIPGPEDSEARKTSFGEIVTDGEVILVAGERELLAENPPPDESQAEYEWVSTVWTASAN